MKSVLTLFAFLGWMTWSEGSAHAVSIEELNQLWPRPMTETLHEEQLNQLLNLMEEDSEILDLLNRILKKIGATTPKEILTILRLCPELPKSQGGLFEPGRQQMRMTPFLPPGEDVGVDPDLAEQVAKSFASEVTENGAVRIARWEAYPKLCIAPGNSLLTTFLTAVHELTHFKGYRALTVIDVLDYRNENEYLQQVLEDEWGEVGAYSAQYRALKRLKQRVKIPGTYLPEKFFNADGDLLDHPGLVKHILDGLGYRSVLTAEFHSRVKSQYQRELSLLTWYQTDILPKIEQQLRTADVLNDQKLQSFYSQYSTNIKNEITTLESRLNEMKKRFSVSLRR